MKKNTGQEFIAAIIGILKEKNASGVYFDPWSFDPALLKDTLPWRKRSDKMIDTVSVPCMWSEDITGSDWTDDDKKRAQEKHFPDCICISVEDGRQIRYGFFDGSEDEDFDSLFHDVYDKLWNGDIETEADVWLCDFLEKRRLCAIAEEIGAYELAGKDAMADSAFLSSLGMKRLTRDKDITESDTSLETGLEKQLAEFIPGGYNDTGDQYFIAELDEEYQLMILIHAGQWTAGHFALRIKDKQLVKYF